MFDTITRPLLARLGYWFGFRQALDADDIGKLETIKALYLNHKVALDELKNNLQGDIVNPLQTERYATARRRAFFYNNAGYPVCIILVQNKQDVQQVLTVVKANPSLSNLGLAVAAGGHSAVAFPDNSIVIDLSLLKEIQVDISKKTVTIGAGCRIGEVDQQLKGTGLAFVTGTNPSIGVCGLTLSGGIGWLGRQYGFAAENLIEVEVVLLSGKTVKVNDNNEYKDLMRGLRGGGGNFGVVVSLQLRLHKVENVFAGWSARFAPTIGSASEVCKNWRNASDSLPDHCTPWLALPCGAPVVICIASYFGSKAKSARSCDDIEEFTWLREVGGWFEAQNNLKLRDYHSELQPLMGERAGRRNCILTSCGVKSLNDDLIDGLLQLVRKDYPSKHCVIVIFRLGGELSRGNPNKSVLTLKKANYWILIQGSFHRYDLPEHKEASIEWTKKVRSFISSHQSYDLNKTDSILDGPFQDGYVDSVDATCDSYIPKNKQFLQMLKKEYDPTNIFRFNKNIRV